MARVSVDVDTEQYLRFTKQLPYGQLAEIIRGFVNAMATEVENNGRKNIIEWLEGRATLTLPQVTKE
jgi:hypothetical protein